MRPGPSGDGPLVVERFRGGGPQGVFAALENAFDEAVRDAEEAARRSGPLSTDATGFANAANRIRSLLLATELAVREGALSRGQADRLVARYSNPEVLFPPDIYREYFLEGGGAAKPAKIRESASVTFEASLFTAETDSLTADIGSSVLKAVAGGAVKELRHQAGLDNKVEYRFTSETPVKPGDVCEVTCQLTDRRDSATGKLFFCTAKLEVNGKLCCKGELTFALIPLNKQ